MSNKKAFKELGKSGQASRLKKYEKQREERGTKQVLARLVRDVAPGIKEIANNAKAAYLRLAVYNQEAKETKFITVSAYIGADKVGTDLEAFYAGLKKGNLVSVEYKETEGYNNAYGVFKRETK